MWKRWLVIMMIFVVPVVMFRFIGLVEAKERFAIPTTPHPVIVNEWSQGPSGAKEWVELLVITGPIDLRGWDLGDDTAGDLVLNSNPFWQNVPAGSLIVFYNAADKDPILPPDDMDLRDCTAVIADTNVTYVTGNLPSFANTNPADNPQIRDQTGAVIHNFSLEPGTALHAGAQKNAQYNGTTSGGISDPAQWANLPATEATPAVGNTVSNTHWIRTLCPFVADLQATKSGPAEAEPGSLATYQMGLSNQGNTTANQVRLTDTLPIGVSYVDDTSGFPMSQPVTGTLVWQVADLPAGTAVTFDVHTTLPANFSGTLTNTVTATTAVTETQIANNTATATTWVHPLPQNILRLFQTGTTVANPGQTITSQFLVQNVGTQVATGLQFSDTLPMGFIYQATTLPTTPTDPLPHVFVWSLPDLPVGESFTFVLTASVAPYLSEPQTLTNIGQVTTQTPEDITDDNRATAVTQIEILPQDILQLTSSATSISYVPGDPLGFELTLSNLSPIPATDVVLTSTLPSALSYTSNSPTYPLTQPMPGVLVWAIGTVPSQTAVSLQLQTAVNPAPPETLTVVSQAHTSVGDLNPSNNTASSTSQRAHILLNSVLFDGYALNDVDEAVEIRNVGQNAADIGHWQLSDGSTKAILPPELTLASGQSLWLTKDDGAFQQQFGFAPDFANIVSWPDVGVLTGAWPGFSNTGDEVILQTAVATPVDALVYKAGNAGIVGWQGPSLLPYVVSGVFAEEGQILYRRQDPATGLPVVDTSTAADWAQMTDDPLNGRKVRYPGWDADSAFFTSRLTETAVLTIAIAPDNAYPAIATQIAHAQTNIVVESLTFENIALANDLIAALQRGVAVTILLEGAPAGGLPDQEKYICQQLEAAGGQCWFMISDPTTSTYDRYRFLHAKFMVIDGRRAIISSENLSPNSLPNDDKSDGTWGRRGVVLITDAPGVIAHLQALFNRDFNPTIYADLFRWQASHPTYGNPPLGFIPITVTGGITYTVRYPIPTTVGGTLGFEIVQSPDNSLQTHHGLLGLINRAGYGDTVLVEQLEERPYWGNTQSNPIADPNPRLEAYINAARRGAAVRLLLDSFFDDPNSPVSNFATCNYVNTIAQNEALNLRCTRSNPAGLGIHNKMVLVQINGQGFVHVGSLNGSEQASKGNRELALQVQSNQAYAFLADMFNRDVSHLVFMPLVVQGLRVPTNHVLISEVLYDSPGAQDDAEFIELANPTGNPIDLSGYSLSDAVDPTNYEDLRHFPVGTIIPPHGTLVVATTATAFRGQYPYNPDFEILSTDPAVPDMIDDPNWGDPSTWLQLSNGGDEVILRDLFGAPVDVITYGAGAFPGIVGCNLVTYSNRSLERYPYWQDSDNCLQDFREWNFPNPGDLP